MKDDEPDSTPVHVFDVVTSPDGQPQVDVRQVNVVSPPAKRKRYGGSILALEFGPALKKLDALDAEKDEPPGAA
jgi:hypothetical protein